MALACPAQTGRPNVLLIMTDDQGYGDFSGHGNPHVQTPNLDRLASEGVEFTRFTVSPVCAPTRASLLTGRYHLRCGIHGVTGGRETIAESEITVASLLRQKGYRTGLVGKWHLGENYPCVPHAMGFDEFVGCRTGHWNRYFDPPAERNGKATRLKGYATDALTDEALGFIDRSRSNPFFLYLAYNAPHAPYQLPRDLFDKYRKFPIPPEAAAVYGMVENIDQNIGRLLTKLKERSLEENTLVLFLTDNGPQTDRYNHGLRARKGSVYEGGTRAPLFVRLPGIARRGSKIDRIAAHIDVAPTILDVCGIAPPKDREIDGRSLLPLLSSNPFSWPDRTIYTHFEPAKDPSVVYPGSSRTQRWKMVNGRELYDLTTDPGEKTDLADRHPEVLGRMKDDYESWFQRVTTPRSFKKPPIPVGYLEENPARLFAPQAALSAGARFRNTNGYAHDWVVEFGQAEFDIDVHAASVYEVGLKCLTPGGVVKVQAGDQALSFSLTASKSLEPIPLPDLVARNEASEMPWETQMIGTLRLPAGVARLTVQGEDLQLKEVLLRRIS